MKKSVNKLLAGGVIAAVFAVLAGVGLAQPVAAESGNTLKMQPTGTKIYINPGETLEGDDDGCASSTTDTCTLKVTNSGSSAFQYKVYVTPYSVTGSDNDVSFTDEFGTAYTQISRWIKVKNAAGEYVKEALFTIEAGETQEISYRIEVPEDIPGGSQYAVIWAQIQPGADGGIQTMGQVGSIISARSQSGSREEATIYDMSIQRFAFAAPLRASAKVSNTGNTDYTVNYRYLAKTLFGKTIYDSDADTVESHQIGAFPETDYTIKKEWTNPPLVGIFSVTWEVTGGGQSAKMTRVVMIMPLIVLILVIFLLTVVIAWIIIIIRKRKERKARKLV